MLDMSFTVCLVMISAMISVCYLAEILICGCQSCDCKKPVNLLVSEAIKKLE